MRDLPAIAIVSHPTRMVAVSYGLRRWSTSAAFGIALMLATAACSPPGGPTYSELAAEPVFAAPANPSAQELYSGNREARWGGVDSPTTYASSFRIFGTGLAPDDVLAWLSDALEADGWSPPTQQVAITMWDGHYSEHIWQRGDLFIGLGFPEADQLSPSVLRKDEFPRLYQVTITYRPPRGSASPSQ